jgi:Ca2+-binding EF-hand superfamily protein
MAIAASAISIGVPLALAQTATDAPPSAAEKFAMMDVDSNGLVNEAEFVAYAADAHDAKREDASEKFAQIAGDDGVITLAEFEAIHTTKAHTKAPSGS